MQLGPPAPWAELEDVRLMEEPTDECSARSPPECERGNEADEANTEDQVSLHRVVT